MIYFTYLASLINIPEMSTDLHEILLKIRESRIRALLSISNSIFFSLVVAAAAVESTASSLSSSQGLAPPALPEEEGDPEANFPQGCHLEATSDLNRHKDQSVIPRSVE